MKPIERTADVLPFRRARMTLSIAMLLGLAACDRDAPRAVPEGIVSLSPAATSLVLAIGAGDRLVGVSTYEADAKVAPLPRVGDYENVDWERIRALAPKTLITQQARDRLPVGFVDAANAASIAICPIQIDRLADIGIAMQAIGDALSRRDAADAAWQKIRADLDALRSETSATPAVAVLIVTSDDGLGVVGSGTFLDELLAYAGGTNAVGAGRAGYFSIDREQLRKIDPPVVVVLAPAASNDAVARIRSHYDALPELSAVKSGRVHVITRGDALMPNANVATTAREFADAIRGGAAR